MNTLQLKTPCEIYQGALNNSGYGPHRQLYEAAFGQIPKGLVVMHKCNTRACINLEHLVLGTQTDNLDYMRLCGRANDEQRSLSLRKTKQGTGIYRDPRSNTFAICLKVFGKPLYLGMQKNKELAYALAAAAQQEVVKLLRTNQQLTYGQVKEYFQCK